jgi:hypothetical protein
MIWPAQLAVPAQQWFDNNGHPLSGGKLFFYMVGTSAKQATFSDAGLSVANTNPVILDSAGRAPTAIFLDGTLSYKLVIAPAGDTDPPTAPIKVVDNYTTAFPTTFAGPIAFPSPPVPSSDPRVLDDYNEIPFQPSLGGTGGQSGQVYLNREGRVVKIGSEVWASFFVALSTLGTISGSLQIQGLPYVAETAVLQYYAGVISNWINLATPVYAVPCYVPQNTAVISLFKVTGATANSVGAALTQADLTNTSGFAGMVMYRAPS